MRNGERDKDVSGRGLCNFMSRLWIEVKDNTEGNNSQQDQLWKNITQINKQCTL